MYDITVKKGRPFRFDIWFGGEPAPTATWIKDGTQTCSNSDYMKIELFSRNTIYCERNTLLTVARSDRPRDKGRYTIKLECSSGTFEASGTVNVLDVPGPPQNFAPKAIGPDRVSFGWDPPEDDGGQKIKYYQIRMMDYDTGEWVIVAEVRKNILMILVI